jgi:hypothetical protein
MWYCVAGCGYTVLRTVVWDAAAWLIGLDQLNRMDGIPSTYDFLSRGHGLIIEDGAVSFGKSDRGKS